MTVNFTHETQKVSTIVCTIVLVVTTSLSLGLILTDPEHEEFFLDYFFEVVHPSIQLIFYIVLWLILSYCVSARYRSRSKKKHRRSQNKHDHERVMNNSSISMQQDLHKDLEIISLGMDKSAYHSDRYDVSGLEVYDRKKVRYD